MRIGGKFETRIPGRVETPFGGKVGTNMQAGFRQPFLLMLPKITAAESRVPLPDVDLAMTVSIGVAECKSATELAEMMKHADIALYEAKRAGRNRVCTYEA